MIIHPRLNYNHERSIFSVNLPHMVLLEELAGGRNIYIDAPPSNVSC